MSIDLNSIHRIRQEYKKATLNEENVNVNALTQFEIWFGDALEAEVIEPNAMTLSTVNREGVPSSRIVLLKKVDDSGFTFFTNYSSKKAADIERNNKVSLLFFWPQLERQVRVTGLAEKVSVFDSEEYFHSRPFASQIGAIASPQSREIKNREILDDTLKELLAIYKDKEVPMPGHWGGYLVKPDSIEFWQGRSNRLHDRLLYTRLDNGWKISRLAP